MTPGSSRASWNVCLDVSNRPQPTTRPGPKTLLPHSAAAETQGRKKKEPTAAERSTNRTTHACSEGQLSLPLLAAVLSAAKSNPHPSICKCSREIPNHESTSMGGHENCPRLHLALAVSSRPALDAATQQARGPAAPPCVHRAGVGQGRRHCFSRLQVAGPLPHRNSNTRSTASGTNVPRVSTPVGLDGTEGVG